MEMTELSSREELELELKSWFEATLELNEDWGLDTDPVSLLTVVQSLHSPSAEFELELDELKLLELS